MNTTMPGFTAEKALNETGAYSYTIAGMPARQFESHNGSVVYPALLSLPSCEILCSRCEEAGGICIHVRGRCLCA